MSQAFSKKAHLDLLSILSLCYSAWRTSENADLFDVCFLHAALLGTNVPVIPCHLRGAYEAMPPQARIPRWKKISMRVGPPLSFEREPNAREGWEQVAQTTQSAVAALAG